jgi:hypothetical protein
LKDWKTMPTSARTRAKARPVATGIPSTRISLSGEKLSSRLMQRIRVDLPDPDGPMMQTTSPLATSRSMPRSASKLP